MTDPAALLTRLEQAKQSRDVWQIGLAEQALEHAAPELAARVLELEAENKRLREWLDQIACAKRVSLDGVVVFESSHEFAERLQDIAEKAFKGGGDMSKFEVTDAMVDAANDVFVKLYFTGNKTMNDAMRAAISAAFEASGILEENARLRAAILDIKQNWDWWDEDRYDRCSSVVGDAIADAMKEPTP